MKFLLDENLSYRICGYLKASGHEATVVPRSFYEFEDLEWAVHGPGCPAGGFGDVASAKQVECADGEVTC